MMHGVNMETHGNAWKCMETHGWCRKCIDVMGETFKVLHYCKLKYKAHISTIDVIDIVIIIIIITIIITINICYYYDNRNSIFSKNKKLS